jgi:predicted DNA-binding antitoxin AbrB/MazE fold protein
MITSKRRIIMTTVKAIYEEGIFIPQEKVKLREHTLWNLVIIPMPKKPAPTSTDILKEAAGILKKYKIDPIRFQKKLRKEWDRKIC